MEEDHSSSTNTDRSRHDEGSANAVRTRTGTPVKNVRPNSVRSDGGLTPLPDDDDAPIIIRSSSPTSPVPSSFNRTPTPLLLRSSSDEESQAYTKSFHEACTEFQDMQQPEGAVPEFPPEEESVFPMGNTEAKIQQGLQRIRELDALLRQKNMLARALTKERLSRESSAAPRTKPGPQENTVAVDSSDDDDEELELKSVHSMETRTFITEPKLGARAKIGIQALRDGGVNEAARSAEESQGPVPPKKKGYKQGDFIQRNIVLGPEARYYSAMTEEEKERVERILNVDDTEEDVPDNVSVLTDHSKPSAFHFTRPTTATTAFFPDTDEFEQLVEIDRKLQLIIPEPEWETKSIVWSEPASTNASGSQTPMPGRFSRQSFSSSSVSIRDITAVMHDADNAKPAEVLLKDEQKQLREIDEKLEALREGDARPISREDLDRLLYECMRFEAELKSRQSSTWGGFTAIAIPTVLHSSNA
ncbi:hypothetical protein SpCBS45565_g06246 [Spizellomyces sp. 'palustris']|nr:hypothetical protein SpCBS45565_g06246 [Spizellomyces sp. 'palustris']